MLLIRRGVSCVAKRMGSQQLPCAELLSACVHARFATQPTSQTTKPQLSFGLKAAAAVTICAVTASTFYTPLYHPKDAQTSTKAPPSTRDPLMDLLQDQQTATDSGTAQQADGSTIATTQSSQQASSSSSGSVSTQPPAVPAHTASSATAATGSQTLQGPWITDPVLAENLQKRMMAENRLRSYLHIKQRDVQRWLDQAQVMGRMTREDFEKEMVAVENEVNLQTNIIMYGIHDPHARRNYLASYGCSKWTEEALSIIRSHSPLIEIGAGLGHWQRELSARGADVLAFDNMSALPVPDVRTQKPEFAGQVLQGDETQLLKHTKRTLLLVYPGPDDMAMAAVRLFKGNTLLYVGESRGGVNGTDAFFDELSKNWECVAVAPVEPFPEGYEKLWVLQRKKQKRKWLW